VAKPFPADFYVTSATVIPVLFLAVAVQGRAYESVLRTSRAFVGQFWWSFRRSAAETGRSKWVLLPVAFVLGMFANFSAVAIVFAGGLGEFLALYTLYTGTEQHGTRAFVFAATLVLLAAVVAGPVLAAWHVRAEDYGYGPTAEQAASAEEGITADQHEGRETAEEPAAEKTASASATVTTPGKPVTPVRPPSSRKARRGTPKPPAG